ncbi:MAG: patatin-like phospholipase family protein [Spirochaetaceae bacterium]|nr:patatin-like phospholipase family protein [Spirochaetaceae bacterium]
MAVYRNLVFKGGGVRGVAYMGAMEYFYREGYMRSVERVAGTSAGAITACVLSLNFGDFTAIKSITDSLDYSKIPSETAGKQGKAPGNEESQDDQDTERKIPKLLLAQLKGMSNNLSKNIHSISRLLQDKGWYSTDYFYNWLRAVIAKEFVVPRDGYTFADFHNPQIHTGNRPFFDLYITGTDVSNRSSRIFSFETTPNMEVALAVRISMSIPLFFEAISYQYPGTDKPQLYADGGVMLNYPIGIFDDTKYCRKLQHGMNMETLGFFLYSSPEATSYKDISNVIDYGGALFDSLLTVQEQLMFSSERNKGRTVFIDDKGIPFDDFSIKTTDERYMTLYRSGLDAAGDFFANRSNWDQIVRRFQNRFGWKGMGN